MRKAFILFSALTLVAITANAQVTILHSLGDGTVPNDGARQQAGLIQVLDGNFYGTTHVHKNSIYKLDFQSY